jgi:hypothetical protein
VKVFKGKLDDLNQRLKETGDRIGKLKKGTRLEVDAISYYEQKLEEALSKWKECVSQLQNQN